MNESEKLVERLREMASLAPPMCQYDHPKEAEVLGKQIIVYCKPFEQFQDLMREAADAIVNGVTVQKWIPVSERLPEVEGEYITYTDREQIHFDCFCIYPNLGTRFWVGGNGKVTHWMPLPEPPKECE